MGKTVPSYRIALEDEIYGWKGFRAGLLTDSDKESFDLLMDFCRLTAMASQNACRPILFEPMVMSMLLRQQQQIDELEKKIQQKELG